MRNEIDYLKKHNTHGNILNIASNAALMPIFGLYGAAKLAIIEWTKALGRQFGHTEPIEGRRIQLGAVRSLQMWI